MIFRQKPFFKCYFSVNWVISWIFVKKRKLSRKIDFFHYFTNCIIRTEIYQRKSWWIQFVPKVVNQEHARQVILFFHSVTRMIKFHYWWIKVVKKKAKLKKKPRALKNGRRKVWFCFHRWKIYFQWKYLTIFNAFHRPICTKCICLPNTETILVQMK